MRIRIQWADPYARDFEVQYWVGDGDAMDEQDKGAVERFSFAGRSRTGRVETRPCSCRRSAGDHKVRAHLDDSFLQHLRHSWIGGSPQLRGICDSRALSGNNRRKEWAFKDLLHHSPDQKQTLTLCSSVDPWHEPSDLYVAPDRMESGDQPGFDLFFTSGITRGPSGHCSRCNALQHAGRCGGADELHQEARLSGFLHRNGGGSRTGSTCCRRTTALFICNSQRLFIVSTRASNWGDPLFRESPKTSRFGPMRKGVLRGWGDFSTT